MSKIISKLRRLRRELEGKRGMLELTQEAVAREIGISYNRYGRLELGKFEAIFNREVRLITAYFSRELGRTISYGDLFDVEHTIIDDEVDESGEINNNRGLAASSA